MRLGYCTWGMPKLSMDEALPALAAMGYDGIELAVTPGWSTELDALDAARRKHIRRLLDDNNLMLSAVAAHTEMVSLDETANAVFMTRLRDSIDLAAEMAAPGQPGIVCSLVGGRVEDWLPRRKLLVERIRALGDYAATRDVTLAVEPHSGTALDTPEKALWLFAHVQHPNVRMNFDISHMDVMGIATRDCVPVLAPLSVHTHVKDERGRWPHHEFLTPGEGPFNYVEYLQAMAEAGYAGFIAVEVSVMVQRRPDYDALAHAAFAYRTLDRAFKTAGLVRER